jgi:kynureninase
LEYLLKTELGDVVTILTPTNPHQRGCQLSLTFNNPSVTCDDVLARLSEQGVIGDVRKPSVIRIAPAPLYNSYLDVFEFVKVLKGILA